MFRFLIDVVNAEMDPFCFLLRMRNSKHVLFPYVLWHLLSFFLCHFHPTLYQTGQVQQCLMISAHRSKWKDMLRTCINKRRNIMVKGFCHPVIYCAYLAKQVYFLHWLGIDVRVFGFIAIRRIKKCSCLFW